MTDKRFPMVLMLLIRIHGLNGARFSRDPYKMKALLVHFRILIRMNSHDLRAMCNCEVTCGALVASEPFAQPCWKHGDTRRKAWNALRRHLELHSLVGKGFDESNQYLEYALRLRGIDADVAITEANLLRGYIEKTGGNRRTAIGPTAVAALTSAALAVDAAFNAMAALLAATADMV